MELDTPPPGRLGGRRWWLVAALLIALFVLVAAGAHTPFVRARVLARVISSLEALGLRVEAERLSYNLLTLGVQLDRVTLSAAHAQTPFVTADLVRADFPWSAVWRGLAIESIDVERPRVVIVRDLAGTTNLPPITTSGGAEPSVPILIGRLSIRGASVRVTDAVTGTSVLAPAVTLDMRQAGGGPLAGALTAEEGVSIEHGGRRTSITTLAGALAFDGTVLSVRTFDVAAPELSLHVDGQIDLLTEDPTAVLRSTASVRLDRLAPWLGLDEPGVGDLLVEGRAIVSRSMAEVEAFHVSVAGGDITGEGGIALEDNGTSAITATWRDLALGPIARAVPAIPVRIASRSSGTLAMEWTGFAPLTARGHVAATLRAPAAPGRALPMLGRVDLELDRRHWTLVLDDCIPGVAAVTARASGQLDARIAATTIAGRARIEIPSVPGALGRLARAGYPLVDTALVERIGGTAHLEVDLGGILGAPRATAIVDAAGLWADALDPSRIRANLDVTTDRLLVNTLVMEVGPNAVTGQGTMRFASGALTGTLAGDLPDIGSIAANLPERWRPAGTARFDATLGGTVSAPALDVRLTGEDLTAAGQPASTFSGRVRLARGLVSVDDLALDQSDGRLVLTGRYDLDDERYAATVVASNWAVTPIATELPIRAIVEARLAGEGTVASPQIGGNLTISRLDWAGHQIGNAEARIAVEHDRTFTADIVVADAELATLVRPSGTAGPPPLDVGGSVTLHATAVGPVDDPNAAIASLELDLANTTVEGLPVRLPRPARLQYTARQITVDEVAMEIGTSVLTANGRLGGDAAPGEDLRVAVRGSIADVLPFIKMVPAAADVSAAGAIDLTARATGPIDAPDITAALSVTSGSFTRPDLPPVQAIGLEATYASGVIAIDDARAVWQGAEMSASGEVPVAVFGDAVPVAHLATLPPAPGPARVALEVTGLTASALAPFLDRETLGQIAGQIDLTATLEADALDAARVSADVTFDRASVELARVPLGQTAPTHLRLADGRLDVVSWNWAGAGNRLDVTGGVDVAGDAPTMDLGLTGSLDLRMIGAFASGVAVAGRAAIDLRATGPAAQPNIDGEVTVVSGDLVMRDPNVAITDLNGALVFAGGRITLEDVTGTANGGTIAAGGTMAYEGFTPTDGSLWIRGRGLALAVPENLRTEIDADLTLSKGDAAPSLKGQIAIVRGSYRRPLSLAQYLFADPAQTPAATNAEPGSLDTVEIDIAIASSEDIVVDNNYGRFGLGSNLRVAGTIGQPAISGRLTVQEGGQVFLGGRTYEVTRGIVDFTNPVGIEPTLDLAFETRVGSNDVTLGISGTRDTLEVSPRSPGLSEADAISLLLTGQLADESAADVTQIAREQLLMLLSGEVLAFAGRAVGFDAVQVGRGLGGAASDFDLLATDTDPTARLTVTKNLSRQLQMVFSQSLRENGDITWIASFKPTRTIELRGSTTDDDGFSYEFRQRLAFGGGADPGAAGQADRAREAPRIADVTWIEVPADEVAVLSKRLRQTRGDQFDFYHWQRDQDDLVSWYRDRGFLEARVTAKRRDLAEGSPANTVVLEYRIERGPATTLTVNGPALPANVMARMREAWAEAVFDGFLVEDLATIGREALIGEGYLNATVTASVASPAGEGVKEIVVDVDRGSLFERREIVLSGNTSVPPGALLAVVDAQTLAVDAWLGASTLEAALEREYHARGYLAADVGPGTPVFTGSSAALPVRIDEGPLFHIGNVEVQGVSARPRDAVKTRFGLETGKEYRPALVEPARRGVERAYRSLGYNDARASVTTAIDRSAARVNVTLIVVEGNQAVLSGVDVTGSDVTARHTIERALDLPVGEPVGLDRVYRAQKGLYDTGVFQQADVTLAPVVEAAGAPPGIQFVRAVVNVRELPRYQFRYGFRLTDEVGPVEATRQVRPAFVADLLRRNLFGRAISTGVAGQIERDRRLLRGLVSLPTLFTLPVVTNFFATTSRELFPAVSEFDTALAERITEFTVEQRFRPARRMGVSYGYDLEHKRTFDPEPDPDSVLPPLDIVARVARLTGTYAWDTRDDPSDAHRGWFHSSGFEYGTKALGSELRFMKYLAQQSYFKTLGGQVVLASAFRLGVGRPFEGQRLDRKFLAGGGTSVRGFAEDALGEVDFFGPVGGDALLVLNQEVRFPIFRWFRGVAFIDAGNVYPTPADLSWRDLEVGTGVGLRIHSPFALVRLDFGMPVTRRDEEPSSRWYFGIGHAF